MVYIWGLWGESVVSGFHVVYIQDIWCISWGRFCVEHIQGIWCISWGGFCAGYMVYFPGRVFEIALRRSGYIGDHECDVADWKGLPHLWVGG